MARTCGSSDKTRVKIGAVIDITGRRVCPIAFCSCKARRRKFRPLIPHVSASLRVIIGFRVRGEFAALPVVGEIRKTSRYELKICIRVSCICILPPIKIWSSSGGKRKKKKEREKGKQVRLSILRMQFASQMHIRYGGEIPEYSID